MARKRFQIESGKTESKRGLKAIPGSSIVSMKKWICLYFSVLELKKKGIWSWSSTGPWSWGRQRKLTPSFLHKRNPSAKGISKSLAESFPFGASKERESCFQGGKQAGRRQLCGYFLCNLDNTRAQQMNKQNCKFANSSNPRDAKEVPPPKQESSQGKSQTRSGVCTFSPIYFQSLGCVQLVLWHFSFETYKWTVLFCQVALGISFRESVLESPCCIKEIVSPELESACWCPGLVICF